MRKARKLLLIFGDIVSAYGALFLTVLIRFGRSNCGQMFTRHFFPFTFLYIFWFAIFYIFNLYDLNFIKPKAESIIRTAQALIVCLAVGIIFFYSIPFFGITPKTNLLIDIFILGIFAYTWRRFFYSLFSSRYIQNVAFLGINSLAINIGKTLTANPQLGYKPVGTLNLRQSLMPQIKKKKIGLLILAEDFSGNKKITEQLYNLLLKRIEIMTLPQAYEDLLHKIPIDFLDQVWFLKNLREGQKRIYDNIKRIEDIIFAILFVLITLPLWLIIAIAIKIDDGGPVFYRQKRISKDKKTFWLWKFRSMIVDAEKKTAKWAGERDERITRVGRIIRRLHIDELPQMINIIKGDISLVGPRPERPQFVRKLEQKIPYYNLRHIIKSGFTGWAQIKQFGKYARSVEDSHEKFQYDLYYIKNRSILLDLGIILKTFQLFFNNK